MRRLRPVLLILELSLIGMFFIQSLRFLIGSLYGQIAGASILTVLDPALIPDGTPGVIDPATLQGQIVLLGVMIGLPLLGLLLGRARWLLVGAALLAVLGRALMSVEGAPVPPLVGAALTAGGGLLYITLLVRQRATWLPYFFILALALDQIVMAWGNTLNPLWSPVFAPVVLALAGGAAAVVMLGTIAGRPDETQDEESSRQPPDRGLLTFWGGIGLGALLFLELSLLALPNAVAGRAGVEYGLFVPLLLAATLLPIIPRVRAGARNWLGMFDSGARGWLWLLLLVLLLVIGTRLQGIIGGAALVLAQFVASLTWWWLVRPQAAKERNLSGLWMVAAVFVFAVLVIFDVFTYEYAFVRNLAPPLDSLNAFIPPLLRGFRGMGLAVLLFAGFLASLPLIMTTLRIPWPARESSLMRSLQMLAVVLVFSGGGWALARPPVVTGVFGVNEVFVGTYNIHGGYNEFFHYDLEAIARVIIRSRANVVLLQEVEAGRLTSFGVDQSLWLARRLGMDRRFFATNEGLQGLAVLSNIPIVYHDGSYLTSVGSQTGLQRVQVQPDEGAITLYNTWLGPLLAGDDINQQESEQRTQLNEIFAIISEHHPSGQLGRTILGGTFHNVPDSPLITRLRSTSFNDPFAGLPLDLSATFARTGVGRARLDYLWLWEQNLVPTGVGVLEDRASDHMMAVAGLLVRRGE